VIRDIPVQVVRKPIKNLHLGVYPPDGQVRVSAPAHLTDDNIRLAVISRLSWIRKQREAFQAQPRQSEREMVTGESHYVFGKRYRLEVIERRGRHEIVVKNPSTLQLFVNPGTTQANRTKVLKEWYRQQLKDRVSQTAGAVGTGARPSGGGLGRPENEDEVGQLQHSAAADLAEPGAGEEAPGVPGVCGGP
jgi:predicted metal-dependent hydrolase